MAESALQPLIRLVLIFLLLWTEWMNFPACLSAVRLGLLTAIYDGIKINGPRNAILWPVTSGHFLARCFTSRNEAPVGGFDGGFQLSWSLDSDICCLNPTSAHNSSHAVIDQSTKDSGSAAIKTVVSLKPLQSSALVRQTMMTQCPVRAVMTEIYTLLLELGPR